MILETPLPEIDADLATLKIWATKWCPDGGGGWNVARRMTKADAQATATRYEQMAKQRGYSGHCEVLISDDVLR